MNNHLTTGNTPKIEELLESCDLSFNILIIVALYTREPFPYLRDEENEWIHRFWNEFLERFPDCMGCRMGWEKIYYVIQANHVDLFINELSELLSANYDEQLESRCIIKVSDPQAESKLRELDEIQVEVSSSMGGWNTLDCIHTRMIDGTMIKKGQIISASRSA